MVKIDKIKPDNQRTQRIGLLNGTIITILVDKDDYKSTCFKNGVKGYKISPDHYMGRDDDGTPIEINYDQVCTVEGDIEYMRGKK